MHELKLIHILIVIVACAGMCFSSEKANDQKIKIEYNKRYFVNGKKTPDFKVAKILKQFPNQRKEAIQASKKIYGGGFLLLACMGALITSTAIIAPKLAYGYFPPSAFVISISGTAMGIVGAVIKIKGSKILKKAIDDYNNENASAINFKSIDANYSALTKTTSLRAIFTF